MHPLISAEELADALNGVVVGDIRWDLLHPDSGRRSYESGHVPGAVFVDLDKDLAAPPGGNGRHPLPDPAQFAASLGRLGIGPESRVVVYDDAAGRLAARMWWMLRSIGHDRSQVLNGGFQAWVEADFEIGIGVVHPRPTTYPTPDSFAGVVEHQELAGRSLIDARAAERYRGDSEPVDPKAGHIPGAVNIPTSRNLDSAGRFLPPGDLRKVYDEISTDPVVSCGSGVTACHTALAMVLAGMEMPDVYVGSFSEWSRLDEPVAVGPSP